MGASDPTSGTVSVREMTRGFGHLLRNGWKPLRTILLVSWDGEEVYSEPLVTVPIVDVLHSTAFLAPPSGARTFQSSSKSTW
jgi:hypothetical protein